MIKPGLALLLALLPATATRAQSAFPQVNIDIGCEDWARRTDPAAPGLKAHCMRLQGQSRDIIGAVWPSTAEWLRAACAQSAVRDNSYTALAECLRREGDGSLPLID